MSGLHRAPYLAGLDPYLQRVQRGLRLAVGMVGALLLSDWVFSSQRILEVETGMALAVADTARVAARPYDYYANAIKKNAFRVKAAAGPSRTSVATMAEEVARLELQGVFFDGDPQALVFDRRAKRTFRVKVGQRLGLLQIVEIKEDRLVLSFKGKTMELPL